jgi:hypothetical protein
VLVFQAPTILGLFGGSSSDTASEPAPAPAPAPAPTPGATATPVAAPGAAGGAALVDSDPAPEPADGQLVSFDRFDSKDPFVQQLDDSEDATTGSPSVPADPGAKGEDPEAGGAVAPAPEPQPDSEPAKQTATIAVNGTEHEVAAGGTFPEDDPVFKLASIRNGVAKIGIVGGGYANGAPTISLRKGGKAVTLLNTADGTTYVLRYVG